LKSKIFIILLIACCSFAQDNRQPEADFKPARHCGECHENIYQAWSESMHASASASRDPLFREMYQMAVKDTKGNLKEKCIVCHSPLTQVIHADKKNVTAYEEGVTCHFCHSTRQISGHRSAADMKTDLTTIYSHEPEMDQEAHPVAHRDFFSQSEFCLPCHAVMRNPSNIQVCSTGEEWKQFYQETKKTCQDCHMPEVAGLKSHRFPRTYVNHMLSTAIDMDLAFDRDESRISVTLTNIGAGHALPTGTPLRMVFLKLTAYDEEGNMIWENWRENPIQEDRSALFMRILGDSMGNGPVPPWRATQTLYQRHLLPAQPVTIFYELNSQDIYDIEANLMYRLAPLLILQKLEITDPHFTAPRLLVQKGIKTVAEM
jgi:hypothetical protein